MFPGHAAPTAQTFNDFTGGLGNFTVNYGNHVPGTPGMSGFDIGHFGSANAGGAAGEMGGQFARGGATSLDMPRILDMASFAGGQTLSLNDPLSVKGKLWLNDISASITLNFGYFNSADPSNQRLEFRITEPSSAGTDLWRTRFRINGTSGSRTTVPDTTWDRVPLLFNFDWTPSGANDGSGTLTGALKKADLSATHTVVALAVGAGAAVFDAFGVWTDSSSSPDLSKIHEAFFDDIEYTIVPEPSTFMLGALGVVALVFQMRFRAARRK